MTLNTRLQAKNHMFMPGDTVSGVIKKYNLFDTTPEEMKMLIDQFKDINTPQVLKPGISALIPILPRHDAKVFNR